MAWNCFWSTTRTNFGCIYIEHFLIDLLFIANDIDIASYINDKKHMSTENKDGIIDSLEKAASTLFIWLKYNCIKGSPNKCHLLISLYNSISIKTRGFEIKIATARNY